MSRELLEEAREILGDCYYHGKEPLSDGTWAMVAKVIKRITAALAEPEPDAMEVVEKLRLGGYALNANDPDDRGPNGDDYHFTFSKAEATALIEDYGRRVPGAMLEELAIEILNLADLAWKSGWQKYVKNLLTAIFAKYGVKLEDAK